MTKLFALCIVTFTGTAFAATVTAPSLPVRGVKHGPSIYNLPERGVKHGAPIYNLPERGVKHGYGVRTNAPLLREPATPSAAQENKAIDDNVRRLGPF